MHSLKSICNLFLSCWRELSRDGTARSFMSWTQAVEGASHSPILETCALPTGPTVGAISKDMALREEGVLQTIEALFMTEHH